MIIALIILSFALICSMFVHLCDWKIRRSKRICGHCGKFDCLVRHIKPPKLTLFWTDDCAGGMSDAGMGWKVHEHTIESFVDEWHRRQGVTPENDRLKHLLNLVIIHIDNLDDLDAGAYTERWHKIEMKVRKEVQE